MLKKVMLYTHDFSVSHKIIHSNSDIFNSNTKFKPNYLSFLFNCLTFNTTYDKMTRIQTS